MLYIYNFTNIENGLSKLESQYILSNKPDHSDILIASEKDLNGLSIPETVNAVVFTDEPSNGRLKELTEKGIVCFKSEENDIIKHAKDFFECGDIKESYNFNDLSMGEKTNSRIAFVIKDFLDPITETMDMLSSSEIEVKKIKAVRREENISYILAEVNKKDLEPIYFEGEIGKNILKYRVIN